MKRCPQCDSSFPDTYKFCDLDGTQLVADYSDSDPNLLVQPADPGPQALGPGEIVEAVAYQNSTEERVWKNWKILAIVAVAGVAIGVVLFIVYHRMTREAPEQSSNVPSNEAVAQQPMPLLFSPPTPLASASPSAEPSPSPSALPSPAPRKESARVAMSSSPVSTGGSEETRRGPVTIRLTNGTSVEADEVWETGEGIWYRRRGVVTLLKRDQIKAIDKRSTSTPSPAATPAASPFTSP
ncbi:MAG: hypothetical protein ND866_14740 [Pyrinomonadaceae bacterium]|nr:hypothetical protein [Pyrinomonadaceae bacterium]